MLPAARSCFSTTFWVAMPAWSVPQIQSVSKPCMPRSRISASWIVPFSAWPMCSSPVTLGGGTAITYGGRSDAGSAEKASAASHAANTRASTSPGS